MQGLFPPQKIKCFGTFLKKSASEINSLFLSIWIEHIDIVAWDRRWELECCIDTKKKAYYPSWRRALYHFHVHRGRLALCLPLMRRWEHGDFFSLLVRFPGKKTLFLFYLRRMCFISWHHQDTYNVFSEPSVYQNNSKFSLWHNHFILIAFPFLLATCVSSHGRIRVYNRPRCEKRLLAEATNHKTNFLLPS